MRLRDNDDQERVFSSTISGYRGQITIRPPFRSNSAASVGVFMFIGRGLRFDDWGCKTLLHEHGHYLAYKKLGFFRFFLGIGLPSMINASKAPKKRRIVGYYNQPWETGADLLANISRKEHTKEAIALSEAYDRYLESIRGRRWFRFLFKDLWKFIKHDFSAL